eukprot:PhM_4_TR10165/c1_g1_i1/m.55501
MIGPFHMVRPYRNVLVTSVCLLALLYVVVSSTGVSNKSKGFSPHRKCTYHNPLGTSSASVCSHRAAHPTIRRNVYAALRSLVVDHHVLCFDLDVFPSSDGVILIGHPKDTQDELGLEALPNKYTLRQLRASYRVPTFPMLLRDFVELLTRDGVVMSRLDFISLEPKYDLATLSGRSFFSLLQNTHPGLLRHADKFFWIFDSWATATYLRQRSNDLRLMFPLRDRYPVPEVCGEGVTSDTVERLLAPYDSVQPSVTYLGSCRSIVQEQLRRSRLHPSRTTSGRAQSLVVWVIDNEATAATATGDGAQYLISNVPTKICN